MSSTQVKQLILLQSAVLRFHSRHSADIKHGDLYSCDCWDVRNPTAVSAHSLTPLCQHSSQHHITSASTISQAFCHQSCDTTLLSGDSALASSGVHAPESSLLCAAQSVRCQGRAPSSALSPTCGPYSAAWQSLPAAASAATPLVSHPLSLGLHTLQVWAKPTLHVCLSVIRLSLRPRTHMPAGVARLLLQDC